MKFKRNTKKMVFVSMLIGMVLGSFLFKHHNLSNENDDTDNELRSLNSQIQFDKPAGPPGQEKDDKDTEEADFNLIIIVVLIIIIIIATATIIALVYLLWKQKKDRSDFSI